MSSRLLFASTTNLMLPEGRGNKGPRPRYHVGTLCTHKQLRAIALEQQPSITHIASHHQKQNVQHCIRSWTKNRHNASDPALGHKLDREQGLRKGPYIASQTGHKVELVQRGSHQVMKMDRRQTSRKGPYVRRLLSAALLFRVDVLQHPHLAINRNATFGCLGKRQRSGEGCWAHACAPHH